MGQPGRGLRHSEGSGPLPHQAGKRFPPVGFQNTCDSAVNKRRGARTPHRKKCVTVPCGANCTVIASIII